MKDFCKLILDLILILILILPTFVLWILFALHFAALGRVCGIGRRWKFLTVSVRDSFIGG